VSNDVVALVAAAYVASHNVPLTRLEAEMNTNLQIGIANAHRQELHRQAANAQLVAEVRSRRSGTLASTAHSRWLRARHLLAGALHATAVAAPMPLAGDSRSSAIRARW
jgi:hypothetical protein